MIENLTNIVMNMTNATNVTGSSNSGANHTEAYALLGIMAFWAIGIPLAIVARRKYEDIRDGKSSPCCLFKADTTTPMHERTYLNLNSSGPVAGFA